MKKLKAALLTLTIIVLMLTTGTTIVRASPITNFKIRIDPTVISRAPRTVVKALSFFDTDGSGRIELTELFEVVRRWVEAWRGGEGLENVDLNSDGKCNLIDFSILLYYVGR